MSKIRLERYKFYSIQCFEEKIILYSNFKTWRLNNEFIKCALQLEIWFFFMLLQKKRFIHFWMNSWCWSIYTDFIRSENWNDISRDHISETLFTKTFFVLVAFNVCLKCKCHRHSVNFSFKKQKSFFANIKINSIENAKGA